MQTKTPVNDMWNHKNGLLANSATEKLSKVNMSVNVVNRNVCQCYVEPHNSPLGSSATACNASSFSLRESVTAQGLTQDICHVTR